jgi:hypothetical protein
MPFDWGSISSSAASSRSYPRRNGPVSAARSSASSLALVAAGAFSAAIFFVKSASSVESGPLSNGAPVITARASARAGAKFTLFGMIPAAACSRIVAETSRITRSVSRRRAT